MDGGSILAIVSHARSDEVVLAHGAHRVHAGTGRCWWLGQHAAD
jgi:hypothetical protein